MNKSAQIAVRAAKMFKQCGRFASYQYAAKRLSPDEMRLYYLARTLEASKGVNHGLE